jgi:hypothetical protein
MTDTPRPEHETTGTLHLVPGWAASTATVGVWHGAEDGVARVTLQARDFPMLPHTARLLGDALLAAADRAEYTRPASAAPRGDEQARRRQQEHEQPTARWERQQRVQREVESQMAAVAVAEMERRVQRREQQLQEAIAAATNPKRTDEEGSTSNP